MAFLFFSLDTVLLAWYARDIRLLPTSVVAPPPQKKAGASYAAYSRWGAAMHDFNAGLIQYFRPFYYVAETGSIRCAASILNLTPSAVSQQIQKLEEALGMPLFDRRQGRTLRLLPAGKALLTRIPSLEAALAQLRNELQNLQENEKPIRVGILIQLHARMLKSIADYVEIYQDTSFFLHTGEGNTLCRELLAGELDLALVFHEHLPPSIKGEPLLSAPLILLVHQDLIRDMGDSPPLEFLRSLPVIYVSGGRRIPTLDAYATAGLTARKRLTVESPIWAVEAVRLKLGAALLNTLVLPDDMTGLKAYPFGPAMLPRRIVLAGTPEGSLSSEVSRFMHHIRTTWKDQTVLIPEQFIKNSFMV